MLVTQSRPRNLKWFHAGPLLYGDWGTSRLYVLGLAFFYTANESVIYLLAIALLMGAVAWAYTIICRSFPDGGGVYTAARQINPTLAVVGATLLLCGYIITVAISVVEALHYFGVHDGPVLVGLAIGIILLIGCVNWLGAKSAGTFALIIAFAALAIALVMAVMVLRYLPDGLSRIHLRPGTGAWPHWTAFTQIVLALAGVEAVANMTGLMKKPIERTAKRTIWPVLVEVVVLNMIFGIAMTGMFSQLPELQGITGALASVDQSTLSPEALATTNEIKNTAMELIARIAATDALGTIRQNRSDRLRTLAPQRDQYRDDGDGLGALRDGAGSRAAQAFDEAQLLGRAVDRADRLVRDFDRGCAGRTASREAR